MHLGVGVMNVGYDASYLQCLLSRLIEESEEYLLTQVSKAARRGKKVQIRKTGDPSEVEVYAGGRYHIMDRDAVAAVMQDEEIASFIDYEKAAVSGNEDSPARVQGRGLSPKATAQNPLTRSMPKTPLLPLIQKKSGKPTKPTVAPVQTPVQSNNPSGSTPQSLPKLTRSQNRLLKSEQELSTLLSSISAAGVSGLSSELLLSISRLSNSISGRRRVVVNLTDSAQPMEKSLVGTESNVQGETS